MTTILRATLVAFDSVAYTATIRPPGSAAGAIAGVPVSRSIPAAELVAGRLVAAAAFVAGDLTDSVVVAVWT